VFALSGLGGKYYVSRGKRGRWHKKLWETLLYTTLVSFQFNTWCGDEHLHFEEKSILQEKDVFVIPVTQLLLQKHV